MRLAAAAGMACVLSSAAQAVERKTCLGDSGAALSEPANAAGNGIKVALGGNTGATGGIIGEGEITPPALLHVVVTAAGKKSEYTTGGSGIKLATVGGYDCHVDAEVLDEAYVLVCAKGNTSAARAAEERVGIDCGVFDGDKVWRGDDGVEVTLGCR